MTGVLTASWWPLTPVCRSVEAVVPGPGKAHQPPQVVLPVGASKDVLLQDGPGAWPAKPSGHFREGEG